MERFSLAHLERLSKDGKSSYGWIRYRTPLVRVSLNDSTKLATVEERDKEGNWVVIDQYVGE